MSEPTRKHPTESAKEKVVLLHLEGSNQYYQIPAKIAAKYRVDSDDTDCSLSISDIFQDLEDKYTKPAVFLKGLRTREQLTQIAMAKKIGVTQSNLSHMEHGRRPIGKNLAKRIASVFKVDFRYFLD